MIEIGKVNKLQIKRFTSVGIYLNEIGADDKETDILLPKSQIPKQVNTGDELEVFVYRDSGDRKIATVNRPTLQVGEMGFLPVVSKTKIGYFMDWGLEKDVLLPFAEAIGHLEKGRNYLVHLYLDKSNRVCASMRIKERLLPNDRFVENDMVKGVIYTINRDFGAFVALEQKYDAMLPKDEMFGIFEIGDELDFRVKRIREDGKIDLSLRDRGHLQMSKDEETIFKKLQENDGFLPLNDSSDPEVIRKVLNMSKAGFKRAAGGLYRQRMILIQDDGITLLHK